MNSHPSKKNHTLVPMHHRQRTSVKPRGAALLTVLVVVVLLTVFVTQVFFYTGVDLQAVSNHRNSVRARALAKASLRGVQAGLQLDELQFFASLKRIQQVLQVAPAPLEEGFLLTLKVLPLDHLFSVNELVNIRQGTDQDILRWRIFLNTFADVAQVNEKGAATQGRLSNEHISSIYAALTDWVDEDESVYVAPDGGTGAEGDNPFGKRPQVEVKNAPLDFLEELRLVRGVADARFAWESWEENMMVWPKRAPLLSYMGKININLASAEEIMRHLENRRIPEQLNEAANVVTQRGVRRYVDEAKSLVNAFVPSIKGRTRSVYNPQTLNTYLASIGFDDNYGTNFLFSTHNERYSVYLQTEVGGIKATLQALVHARRNGNTRQARTAEIVYLRLR